MKTPPGSSTKRRTAAAQVLLGYPTPILISLILRCLRGRRSTSQMSRKLGFLSNQVSRWENGSRKIAWVDFIRYCQVCDCDAEDVFRQLFFYNGDVSDSKNVVKLLLGSVKIKEGGKVIHKSRFQLSRWISGKAEVKLEDILLLIDRCHILLSDFLFFLLKRHGQHPISKKLFKQHIEKKKFFYAYPEAQLVYAALDSSRYQLLKHHDDVALAEITQMPRARVQEIVRVGEQLKIVEKKSGKYFLASFDFDARGSLSGLQRIYQYLVSSQLLERINCWERRPPAPEGAYDYQIFCADKQTMQELRQILRETHNKMIQALTFGKTRKASQRNLYVFTMGLFSPGEIKE